MMARDLGKVNYFTEKQTRELLELKRQWGFTDPRLEGEMRASDLGAGAVFRETWQETGVESRAFEPPEWTKGSDVK
jgi:L-fuculose-phosphate aldolase